VREQLQADGTMLGCRLDTVAAVAVIALIFGCAVSGILNSEAGITLGVALGIGGVWEAKKTRVSASDLVLAYRGKRPMHWVVERARTRGGDVEDLIRLSERTSVGTARWVVGSLIALLIGALIGMIATR
jgi:hypothetical protein